MNTCAEEVIPLMPLLILQESENIFTIADLGEQVTCGNNYANWI